MPQIGLTTMQIGPSRLWYSLFHLAPMAWGCADLSAATVTLSGEFEIVSTAAAPSVALGDRFYYHLQLDDSVADVESSNKQNDFPGAVLAFSLTRVAGTGSWMPPDTFTTTSATLSGATTPMLVFSIPGTGFLGMGGFAFESFSLGLTSGFTIADTGVGQTLSEQLGGGFPTNAGGSAGLHFRLASGLGIGGHGPTTANVVPEPGLTLLFALGAAFLIPHRMRQRRSTSRDDRRPDRG